VENVRREALGTLRVHVDCGCVELGQFKHANWTFLSLGNEADAYYELVNWHCDGCGHFLLLVLVGVYTPAYTKPCPVYIPNAEILGGMRCLSKRKPPSTQPYPHTL